jgi:hypothetical protein
MRETTRVERRWDMESEKQSDSGVEHGNDLCSMHKGLAHLGKLGGRIKGGQRAQVFEFRSLIGSKCEKCLYCRNGVKGMNTLDA